MGDEKLLLDVIRANSPRTPVAEKDWSTKRKEQDLKMRMPLFLAVVGLMLVEVGAIFFMAMCQGFGHFFGAEFKIEEWVLASLSGGVLLQTFGLAKIITHALFYPDNPD